MCHAHPMAIAVQTAEGRQYHARKQITPVQTLRHRNSSTLAKAQLVPDQISIYPQTQNSISSTQPQSEINDMLTEGVELNDDSETNANDWE